MPRGCGDVESVPAEEKPRDGTAPSGGGETAEPRRLDLTWWPRSGPSPSRLRVPHTTSVTATTRRTTPSTTASAPGRAAARSSSVSKDPSPRTSSARCPKAACWTAAAKQLGRTGKDSEVQHRPGRDLTFSAPNSVSFVGLVGGDARVVDGHDRAVARTFDWFERKVAESGETAVRIVTSGHAMMGGCTSVRVDRMAAAPTLPQSSEDLKQLELEHCCRVPD